MNIPQINTIPVITTDRLILRELSFDDGIQMAAIRSDPEVNRYINRQPCLSVAEAELFIKKIMNSVAENTSFYRAVCLKEDNKLIGTVCLWNISSDYTEADLGYELMPGMQGKGIMTEAVKCVIKVGFELLAFKRIIAVTAAPNQKSIALLTRLGFAEIDDASALGLQHDETAFVLNDAAK